MKRISSIALVSILGVSLSSCTYMKEFGAKRKELDEAKTSIKVEAKGQEAEKEEEDPLAKAIEDADKIEREQDIVGLIAPTNPEVRVRGSVRGRSDPFATVAVRPQIEVEQEEVEEERTNNRRVRGNRQRNVETASNPVSRPRDIVSTPTIEDTRNAVSPTETAENVLVTGLVELGDRIRVIVQAPGEATSRYVDIGQYISNGRVLVKRIESGFSTPRVVLEESGVEVSKAVGEAPTGDEQAILPPPPPASVSWLSNYLAQTNSSATE